MSHEDKNRAREVDRKHKIRIGSTYAYSPAEINNDTK